MADVKVPKLLHKMSTTAQKAWYKKHGMEMPTAPEGKSAAAAKKVKAEPRKEVKADPNSIRALNKARQQKYYEKGGRQPIGAGGSGGASAMAGVGQSTAKEIIKGIKAGFNPKVALVRYTNEQFKKQLSEKMGEYTKYGQPTPGYLDIDPKAGDTPPKTPKYKPLKYKMKKEETEQIAERVKENKAKKNEFIRQLGLKAMRAGKVDPAKGYIPTRAGRAELKKEEVEQIDEIKISDVIKATRGKSPEEKQKIIQQMRDKENASKPKTPARKLTPPKDIPMHQRVYPDDMKYHGDSVELEGPVMNEVTKKEAESTLGGAVKEKPKSPPGKQPAGYRYVRGLARKALKAGLKKEEVSVDEEKKPDASMAMTHQLKMKAISDKDKRTLGKVAALMAAQKKNVKEESEMKYIEEKLSASDPASKWISDFVKSDNPKFAGKSKKERINQALGAYYAAKRGKNEEFELEEAKKAEEMEDEEKDEMEDEEEEEENEKEEMDEAYVGFKKLKASIAAKGGARDPAAVAAAIGRKKYGKEKFQAMAAAGKKKSMKEAMDPVGREDKDIDNDKDVDKTDVYLAKRRKAIGSAIRKKVADKLGK